MVKFFCPTREQIVDQLIALLPHGRAWQTRENGPQQGYDIGFDPGYTDGFQIFSLPTSIIRQFINAMSETFHYVTDRLCALQYEFWCATHKESHDDWLVEYGLPDDCDPFPDLCLKVAAIGGTRCEYYQYIAERAGWSLYCVNGFDVCGTILGGSDSYVGMAMPGHAKNARVQIVVDLDNSPAFVDNRNERPLVGLLQAGQLLGCGPNLSALECVLARVVHAEIQIDYEVI